MNLEKTIELAIELAEKNEEIQIVGKIDGGWCIAGEGDEGRIDEMGRACLRVSGVGIERYDYEDWETDREVMEVLGHTDDRIPVGY